MAAAARSPRGRTQRRFGVALGAAFAGLAFAACSTEPRPREDGAAAPARQDASPAEGGESASAAGGDSGSPLGATPVREGEVDGGPGGSSDAGPGPAEPAAQDLLRTRVRRLSTTEYDATVEALFGTTLKLASGPAFPPDLRQDGFTVNADQRVDAVIFERLWEAADSLVAEALENGTLARLAPCTDSSGTDCATAFITDFGAKTYRRPLSDVEVNAALALYEAGAKGAEPLDGIAHVARGMLQSASFLYLTELGEDDGTARGDGLLAAGGAVQLSPHELASSMSYLLTSSPPDDELLGSAMSGALYDPAEREAQAMRLFETEPRAAETVVRLVREWLGVDRIEERAKDSLVYPEFQPERDRIILESREFVDAVVFQSNGTLAELFGANWTVDSGPLSLYRTRGAGPMAGTTELEGRVGILNQAAFLATFAAANESHPVFRGVAVAQRVLCLGLDSPASFNIQVVPPPPDPSLTTRERYRVHSQDELCAGCHEVIDPLGFAFEHFDGMGRHRQEDQGKPVDSVVEIAVGHGLDGTYQDSNDLARALAESARVEECFARFMMRAAAATGDSSATPGEAAFIDAWRSLPDADRGSIERVLIALVASPTFSWRFHL